MASLYDYWWEHDVALFDTETTGFPENDARIVEVGVARFHKRECVAKWGSLINPGVPIPEEASAIHGITDADVRYAPTFLQALPRILNLMHGAWPAAYNAVFDQSMFNIEVNHAGIELPPHPMTDPTKIWLDPLTWVRKIDGIWAGNKLTEAATRWNVSLNNAHRAEFDACASGELLYRIGRQNMPSVTMCELLRQQRVVWREHEEERRTWYATKKIPYRSSRLVDLALR
jgi:DNA polymerase-3 subunit epsilon